MTTLVERVVAVCDALDEAGLSWGLGGALALAYATEEPRGTRDIDLNVFVPGSRSEEVLRALPKAVRWSANDVGKAARDQQVRVWWDDTPVDLFFAADPYHADVDRRCSQVPFASRLVRTLASEPPH